MNKQAKEQETMMCVSSSANACSQSPKKNRYRVVQDTIWGDVYIITILSHLLVQNLLKSEEMSVSDNVF